MNDFSRSNFFLSTIYDLFEEVQFGEKPVKEKKRFFNKNKEKSKRDKIYEMAMDKVEFIKNNIPDFSKLFDFCTFIRSMEKVFFFKNDNKSIVSSDSDINNFSTRNMYINTDNYMIKIYLTRTDNYTTENIEIQVTRKYGKKLTNNFKIKNRDIVYNDSDDLMLINVLNMLLQNIMANIFKSYIDAIYNEEILDLETYEFFNPMIKKEK